VDVLAFTAELDQLRFEVAAHIRHDFLQPGQVSFRECAMTEFRDEDQVDLHCEHATCLPVRLGS